MPMRCRASLFVQYHQPGAIPPFKRRLSNELLRQIIIEIRCFQNIVPAFFEFSPDIYAGKIEFQNLIVGFPLFRHSVGPPLAHTTLCPQPDPVMVKEFPADEETSCSVPLPVIT